MPTALTDPAPSAWTTRAPTSAYAEGATAHAALPTA